MSATGACESGVAIWRTSYSILGDVHRGGSSTCGRRGGRSTADNPTIPSTFPLGRGAAPGASVTPAHWPRQSAGRLGRAAWSISWRRLAGFRGVKGPARRPQWWSALHKRLSRPLHPPLRGAGQRRGVLVFRLPFLAPQNRNELLPCGVQAVRARRQVGFNQAVQPA